MTETKKKLAVLVSGDGTNLQAIIDAIKDGTLSNTEISIVISNKKDAYALKRAEQENIKTVFLNPKDFPSNDKYDEELAKIVSNHKADLIILAGYIRILTESFVNAFEKNKIINIHPALLPKFGGKGMYGKNVHKAVLEEKEKESGCTVHYVTTEVDSGPIISQVKVPVYKNDTVELLSKRIQIEERKLLVNVIKSVLFNEEKILNVI